tara:strand:+ start:244 stop:468 length:225 start_codon:yes stop_codon:yes gene_type:complete
MEEAIIYAFILCVFIFVIIDAIYRVSMVKDLRVLRLMMNDIHHMLFIGSNEEDIEIAQQNYETSQDEISSWDEA